MTKVLANKAGVYIVASFGSCDVKIKVVSAYELIATFDDLDESDGTIGAELNAVQLAYLMKIYEVQNTTCPA